MQHPVQLPVHDRLGFFGGQPGAELGAQPADLAFLLQMDQGRISVVVPDAEFLTQVDPIHLFPERPVVQVVKIQASDQVFPALRMRIRNCNGPKSLADRQQIRVPDLVFPFVTVSNGHNLSPFPLLSGGDHTQEP